MEGAGVSFFGLRSLAMKKEEDDEYGYTCNDASHVDPLVDMQ